jgi:SAM-dependent methyltransferase
VAEPIDWEYDVEPVRNFRYLRCDACRSEWLDPRPTDAELVDFYPAGYHAYNDDHGKVAELLVAARSVLRGRHYRSLLPGDRRSGALFDVGTGDCRHFRELSKYADFSFGGVEINPAMAQRGRDEGYAIEEGTLETIDIEPHLGRYDIVSMNHVIEHVLDPPEVARRAFSLLKPGGWLIGQLPTNSGWESRWFDEAWAGYHFPRHLQVFSRDGLQGLWETAGFADVHIRSAPHCQIAISAQNWLRERGWKPKMEYGRSPAYSVLLIACSPLEVVAAVVDRGGTVDFRARRPD